VEIRAEQKSQMLQQVARYMLEHAHPGGTDSGSELNAIAYGPLQDVLVGYLSDKYQRAEGEAAAIAVSILQHLTERTYVLAGVGERIFGFVHRTFMEYFAACDCLREFNSKGADFDWLNREIFGAHWQDPPWEEVLPLLIAMLHGQGTPISAVIGHVRGSSASSSPHRVAAAARLLGEAGIPQDQAQGERLLVELAEAVERYPTRSGEGPDEFVVKALGAFADLASVVTAPEEVRRRIAALNESGTVAGRFAGWQMGFALRTRKERLDYAVAAVKDAEEAVRLGAIAALEHEWPGRTDLGPVLAEVVQTDSESRVSLAALTAVQRSWRHEPAILDAIDGRAGTERSYKVVRRFIEYLALAWPGNARALEVLLSLAGPQRKWPLDESAFIASAAAAAVTRGWPVQDIAAAFVLNRGRFAAEAIVRQAVIDALAAQRPGDAGVLAFIRERAVDDDAPSVRASALMAIAVNCQASREMTEFILGRAVDDPSASVRNAVIWAIVGSWPEHSLQVKSFISERAVNDGAPSVRAALLKLRHLASAEENADFLRERAVADPEALVRAVALLELSRIADINNSQRFVTERVADDADPVVRCGVLKEIAPMVPPCSWAATVIKSRASQDSVPEVRAIALSGLAHQWPCLSDGDRAFVRDRVSRDPNAIVRKAAILEFGLKSHWDPGQAGDRLSLIKRRAAIDKAVSVRQAALSALIEAEQRLHLTDTQKFIEDRVINDRSASVRGATLQGIMRSPIFHRLEYRALVLDRAANDPDEGVRSVLSAELEEREQRPPGHHNEVRL
jgi:hypothetical protein